MMDAEAAVREGRVGGRALLLISDALKATIVRLLGRGPLLVPELQSRLSLSSRTAKFARLRELERFGLIVRTKEAGSPPLTRCMLSEAGWELLGVVRLLRQWSRDSPGGVAAMGELLGTLEAKALALGWNSRTIRWLAERPHSLTELVTRATPRATYHEVRKVRECMSEAGVIEPVANGGRATPYALTAWGRLAPRPLAAAIRWERAFLPGIPPSGVDAEALLLLLVSSHSVPGGLAGTCRLWIDGLGGIDLEVGGGKVLSALPAADVSAAQGELSGPLAVWLDAMADGRIVGIRARGHLGVTRGIVRTLAKSS